MHQFFTDFKLGVSGFMQAHKFLAKHKLLWVFVFPLVLNVILFLVGLEAFSMLTEKAQTAFLTFAGGAEFWSSTLILKVVWTIIEFAFHVIFLLLFAYIGGYLVLAIMSPVLAWLSEKVAEKLTGQIQTFDLKQFIRDVWRGIAIALRNLFIEIAITLLALLAAFIPVLGLASPLVMFAVTAYFYGFSFMDYTNERQKLSINKSITEIRKHKGLAISTGSIFSVFLTIPYIGILLSSFVAIYSVTGATIAMCSPKYQQIS